MPRKSPETFWREQTRCDLFAGILLSQGRHLEAAERARFAISLEPGNGDAHYNLGNILSAQGLLDRAVAEYRTSIRLKPDLSEAHNNLANGLNLQGHPDQAIGEYQAAIRIVPDYAESHCGLGLTLILLGKFAEGIESLERGHALGIKKPGWRFPAQERIASARRLMDLESKIPAFLRGEAKPKDLAERLALADLCYKTGRYANSVRFYVESFAESPTLGDDPTNGQRCNAARSAALAASGRGKGEPSPDDGAKVKLRERALDWLRADLAAWAGRLEAGDEQARKEEVERLLSHWKEDVDLACIRGEANLAAFPEGEREGIRALWADVDRLLAKSQGKAP